MLRLPKLLQKHPGAECDRPNHHEYGQVGNKMESSAAQALPLAGRPIWPVNDGQVFPKFVEDAGMLQLSCLLVRNAEVPRAEYLMRQDVVNGSAGFDEADPVGSRHAERNHDERGNVHDDHREEIRMRKAVLGASREQRERDVTVEAVEQDRFGEVALEMVQS